MQKSTSTTKKTKSMEKKSKEEKITKKREREVPVELEEPLSESGSVDTDDEEVKVRIGRIPYQWYEQFKHFGYDNKLNKVEKQKQMDKIEEFILKSENKDWWRTIRDQLNITDIVLTDQQLELIDRIRSGKYASKTIAEKEYKVEYEYTDPFPIHAHPPSKKNFMPSKWERMKVNKILQGILSGRIKLNQDEEEQQEQLFDVWNTKLENVLTGAPPVSAPKMKLPTHHESYNPPEEYLFDEKELEEWKQMDELDRPTNFVPQKFSKIRHIPFYDKLINQRFERCLDLYLCPRVKKKKLNINPDQLIPKIPQPDQLRPFPTALNITYIGHNISITCISISPSGNFFITADKSGLIIIWETLSSRNLFSYKFQESVSSVDWSKKNMVLIASGSTVYILNWKYPKVDFDANDQLFQESILAQQSSKSEWVYYSKESQEYIRGFRLAINFKNEVKFTQFHAKGDYFLTVCPSTYEKNEVVVIHHLSKSASQKPFNKSKGLIEKVFFHPTKPNLIVMTRKNVYIFNLQKQAVVKKLLSGVQWNSCLAIHPYGDNIIIGSEDKKLIWYDLDMGEKPYKTMEYHQRAITQTDFHKNYPLMASSSNDGTIHIFHAKVFTDVMENALIVPLKILKGHLVKQGQGVKDIKFHPIQPWIFSVGSDHKICLWT